MALDAFLEEQANDEFRIVRTQLFPERWRLFCDQYDLIWNYTPFLVAEVANISNGPWRLLLSYWAYLR